MADGPSHDDNNPKSKRRSKSQRNTVSGSSANPNRIPETESGRLRKSRSARKHSKAGTDSGRNSISPSSPTGQPDESFQQFSPVTLSPLPVLPTSKKTVTEKPTTKLTVKSVLEVASPRLIPHNYLEQALQANASRERRVRILLEERKWQRDGWDDLSIEMFINQLAAMDSNNYVTRVGVGEREGRIYSRKDSSDLETYPLVTYRQDGILEPRFLTLLIPIALVSKRHYHLCHGLGRSGDLGEPQPKAIGSSVMASLVNALCLDMCKTLVSSKVEAAFLSPMATGMSLTLVLLALKREKPKAKFVVWPRIDQKSCFKSIITAGLDPLVIEGNLDQDTGQVQTNLDELSSVVNVYGAETILCCLSTTSCFAPRIPDSLEGISKICSTHNIFHVVNNAYGLQNSYCAHQILEGSDSGRLDVFVQSTDKNLMVPVGGAIIAGFDKDLVQKIRQTYPGRASSSQSLDLLITLLSMGSSGYSYLVMKTKENYAYLKTSLDKLAASVQEKVIQTPRNRISMAMTLNNIAPKLEPPSARSKIVTQLGSMLFRRHVGGCRVVTGLELKTVEGHQFRGWGAHCNSYPWPYLTAAASIGMERRDVDSFIKKLDECYKKLAVTFVSTKVLDFDLEQVEVED